MIVTNFRRAKDGTLQEDGKLRMHLRAIGAMAYGFFVSLAADLLYCFLFGVPTYTSDLAVNAKHLFHARGLITTSRVESDPRFGFAYVCRGASQPVSVQHTR
ncbi:MAG: hypothetical protein ACHP78_16180 [Terriglobales bacterium]